MVSRRALPLISRSPSRLLQTSCHPPSFSIYAHWPYCAQKCVYCAFNKYVNPRVDHDRMRNALVSELREELREYRGRPVNSIYFGGGTPTLALPSTFEAILDEIRSVCDITPDTEITIEGNPTSVEADRLREFAALGVNRVSLGIQSFNDNILKLLGRDHSAKEALRALHLAKRHFPRTSFDLIYGRGDDLEEWKRELRHALELAGEHVSMYQLTVERGTPFFNDVEAKRIRMPDEDVLSEFYEVTVQIAQDFGFTHYEVSSFARHPRAVSRHNFGYWRGLDYIGIGPGAHGRVWDREEGKGKRNFRIPHPETWMRHCEQLGNGLRKSVSLPRSTFQDELVLLALRTTLGIPNSRFSALTGIRLKDALDMEEVATLIEGGFLVWDEEGEGELKRAWFTEVVGEREVGSGGLRPTAKGLQMADEIVPRILRTHNRNQRKKKKKCLMNCPNITRKNNPDIASFLKGTRAGSHDARSGRFRSDHLNTSEQA
ncbi:uncharacterized protein VTP21DRAFT_1745 [Calcarisporiella thermophila]|uniref:uncharacterized protein n=1 Tax=Calcarisporiella thermophila TaxID=911321 RepID=UPI0037445A01